MTTLQKRTATRPAPVHGCVWVPLTQGKFALIDEADAGRVLAHIWYFDASTGYARANVFTVDDGWTIERLHRFLLRPPVGQHADHVNGDKLDNRRSNLRVASTLESSLNKRKRCHRGKPAASRFRGVERSASGKWVARIKVRGRRFELGRFTNEEEAGYAYDEAARRLHGAFARLNFMPANNH